MKRFINILLVADGESWQDTALRRAITLAEHNQARLTIIRVLNHPRSLSLLDKSTYERLKNAFKDDWQAQLKRIVADAPAGVNIKSKLLFGSVFSEIIQEVLRGGYDLVMKCAEETHSFKERLFGSTDMHLLRKCPCPVWIMKANEKEKYQRIIAAVDVEQEINDEKISVLNQQILEMASSLALSEFSEFHIVHAWTAWGESLLNTPRFSFSDDGEMAAWVEQQRVADETKMNDLIQTLTETLSQDTMDYIKPQVHIIKGEAHQVIPDLAQEMKADLVVMGTVARTGIPGLIMGNTAETILNNIGCSVLAVKPPGFVTPVKLEKLPVMV
ncbi:MAG TPA: universal stress protein, UspA [Desulfobulbus sp.]|nr:universal stress protein, UspA [Desulfobulbus sp.]